MKLALLLAVLATVAVASSTAATSRAQDTIRACVDGNGNWTDGRNGCANDQWVTWNTQGPPGPAGPAGAPGEQGPAGEAGAQGPPGTLSASVRARLTAQLKQLQTLETKLARAPAGSAQQRALTVAALRLQRQTTSALIAALG